jgi:hypothetical protein
MDKRISQRLKRAKIICRLYDSGVSEPEIGKKFGITKQRVNQLRKWYQGKKLEKTPEEKFLEKAIILWSRSGHKRSFTSINAELMDPKSFAKYGTGSRYAGMLLRREVDKALRPANWYALIERYKNNLESTATLAMLSIKG